MGGEKRDGDGRAVSWGNKAGRIKGEEISCDGGSREKELRSEGNKE